MTSETDMKSSAGEKRSHSVGIVRLQKHFHCTVVLQSGASSLTEDLWLSTDSGCREHFNQTTDRFHFGHQVSHRININ